MLSYETHEDMGQPNPDVAHILRADCSWLMNLS